MELYLARHAGQTAGARNYCRSAAARKRFEIYDENARTYGLKG
jgi:hypothetical protein